MSKTRWSNVFLRLLAFGCDSLVSLLASMLTMWVFAVTFTPTTGLIISILVGVGFLLLRDASPSFAIGKRLFRIHVCYSDEALRHRLLYSSMRNVPSAVFVVGTLLIADADNAKCMGLQTVHTTVFLYLLIETWCLAKRGQRLIDSSLTIKVGPEKRVVAV